MNFAQRRTPFEGEVAKTLAEKRASATKWQMVTVLRAVAKQASQHPRFSDIWEFGATVKFSGSASECPCNVLPWQRLK